MKIALAQLNFHIGNIGANFEKICTAIIRAKAEGAQLAVFSELAICGYPPQDLLEFSGFISAAEGTLQKIAELTDNIAVIIGAPIKNSKNAGNGLLNSAVVMHQGKILHHAPKTLLPNYDIFDERRYFEPIQQNNCITLDGKKILLSVCEDLWFDGDKKNYPSNPFEHWSNEKPDLILNIAASPFSFEHPEARKKILSKAAKLINAPVFYVNAVGAQTDLVFDGGSMVLNREGNVVSELDYFKEDFQCFDLDWVKTAKSVPLETDLVFGSSPDVHTARIHKALVLGITDYFAKMGFKKAVLGLSGGIDSSVVAALAAEALGAENVLGILLPSPFSSDHSISDALDVSRNLNISHQTIYIEEAMLAFDSILKPLWPDAPNDVTEENIQARIRGLILMAISNKKGHLLLNTTNKSEAAVGYGTLYGDMCGAIAVLGDLYKTQVYNLAHYLNRDGIKIPTNIITKAPSAELRPNQKDSDSLPDYELLDRILKLRIEHHYSKNELITEGLPESVVLRVLKLLNQSEYKRHQMPPVLRVSSKAFGSGRRFPIVAQNDF
jgi:NAD+ synthase (glutamine-hydrolysing)